MATYTTNYNLKKPDSSDPFGDFRGDYNDNLDIIDANLGGGGGSGGHTIYDKDGNALAQESGLQFTGSVNVTDDNVNGRTVVDITGGGGSNLILDAQIYSTEEKQVGVWIDNKPLYQKTLIGTYNSSATSLQIDVLALNIDKIGNAFLSISSANYMAEEQDYYSSASDHIRWYYEKSNNKITLEFGNTYPEKPFEYRLTIQYTKTTDTAGSGGYEAYGFSPVIYSDVERVIGVWRDNKPLYAKVISLGGSVNINAYSWYVYGTLAEQINIVEAKGYNDVGSEMVLFLLGANCDTNNDLSFLNYRNSSVTLTHIAIQYTKTSDVAGSGDYNTYGVPTVHYSTSEQVIGTWINSKPLYQKTVYYAGGANGNVSFTHGISDIDEIVSVEGIAKDTDVVGDFIPFARIRSDSLNIGISDVTLTSVIYYVPSQFGGRIVDIYATIQYTKTTD